MDKKQEEELREHYNYPKNNKKLENYNAKGIGKNPENFGEVVMYLQVGEDEKIEEIGFDLFMDQKPKNRGWKRGEE